jgi:hypothetical protein
MKIEADRGLGAPGLPPALRFFRRLLAPLHHLSLVRQARRTSLNGRHPYQCTIRRYRSWRGRYNGSNAVISRRRGSRANARGANGWYRNCRRRCGQTHPGILANDGGPGRFDGKARMFRAIIHLSQRATRLRQSGGTNHRCGDSQRKNAIRHTLVLRRFLRCPTIILEFWPEQQMCLTVSVLLCESEVNA